MNLKLYHWTKKTKKYYIQKTGLKIKRCIDSPTGYGIYASTNPEKWRGVVSYDYDAEVICFSFDSKNLKIKRVKDKEDVIIVLENIPPEKIKIDEYSL